MKKRLLSGLAALTLAALLAACAPEAPAPSETTPPPEAEPSPVWGEQVFERDYAGEESTANVPEGVVVSLRFVMPYIENAGENPVWQQLNESFAGQGNEWLQKGREYLGAPGLEPGGDYSVESVYTIQRCDRYLSIRYQRTEALAGEPAVTTSGATFDLTTGQVFYSLEPLFQDVLEEGILLDAVDIPAHSPYDRAYYEGYFSFRDFYLTGEHLVLLFPVYADGATSPTATLERPIPLSQLQELLIPPLQDAPSEGPRALSQEEIDRVNEAFASWTEENGVTIATPVSGFFTSYYDDVTRLDFAAFLQYFPDDGTLSAGDEAEAAALAALPGYPWGISPGSVPIHRITRASVDAALERYAGITSAGLAGTSGVPCLEDYDAWYTFTSDFGPGMFVCAGGQVDEAAGTALLWSEPWANGHRAELTLQKDGENWHIRAHRNTADQALLERLANLTAEDIGYVSWYGSNESPSAEELAELLRQAAEHPIDHDSLTLNGSATDVVWTLDCYLAPKDQETYSGDDALYLQAGLEENVVEVFGGANLPGGRLHLESEALYQLLRTSLDTPDDIDQEAYAACKALTDAYYDARLAQVSADGGFVGWELTGFREADDETALDARAYAISAAFYTDPPEGALRLLAGGMYVDSSLRAHGLDWQRVYLVTIGGEPAGVLRQDWEGTEADSDPLGGFSSTEALWAALWTPGMEL